MNINSGIVHPIARHRDESGFTSTELLLCIGTGVFAVVGVILVLILHRRLARRSLAAKSDAVQSQNLSQNEIEHLLHQVGKGPADDAKEGKEDAPAKKASSFRWRPLNVGLSLVFLAMLFGLSLYCVTRSAPVQRTAEEPVSTKCYLLCNHQVSGPYPLAVILNLNSNGLLRSETLYRPETSADWNKLPGLISAK